MKSGITLSEVRERLKSLGFPEDVTSRYDEPHRFYHTTVHLLQVMDDLKEQAKDDELFLAAVYHDAVYDPKRTDNEERSAELFIRDSGKSKLGAASVENIAGMIRDTKNHQPRNEKSELLIRADLAVLNKPLGELIEHEHQVFREYQFAPYPQYRAKRLELLEKLNTSGRLDALIEYVRSRKPRIGVFCGSFNPFHKGHYNVLKKAERIFDKVIIAFGRNPDKQERTWERPAVIGYHQQEEYSGLLTDFVASLGHEVVVVRGLRNSTDFQYEQNQYRYIQELMPEIRIINIFCDKEFEHISSSGIRTLEKFNRHQQYLLP